MCFRGGFSTEAGHTGALHIQVPVWFLQTLDAEQVALKH